MQDFNIERFEIDKCFYLSSQVTLISGTFIKNNTNPVFPFSAELWKDVNKYNELIIASYRLVSSKRLNSDKNYYVFETTGNLSTIVDDQIGWYLICHLPVNH